MVGQIDAGVQQRADPERGQRRSRSGRPRSGHRPRTTRRWPSAPAGRSRASAAGAPSSRARPGRRRAPRAARRRSAGPRSSRNATAATNGRRRYVSVSGRRRSMAANRIRPTVTIAQNDGQGQRRQRRRRPEVGGHEERRPVAVRSSRRCRTAGRMPRRVQKRRRQHEACRAPAHRARSSGSAGAICERQPKLPTRTSTASRIATMTGRPHQKPRPTKIATKTGRERRPQTEQRVEVEDGPLDPVAGRTPPRSVLIDGTVRPKPMPRLRRRQQQHRVRQRARGRWRTG